MYSLTRVKAYLKKFNQPHLDKLMTINDYKLMNQEGF